MTTARVVLFKPSGKYYTAEEWTVPENAIGPYDLRLSPDFRRIDGGAVLVEEQKPWGYPHLIPADSGGTDLLVTQEQVEIERSARYEAAQRAIGLMLAAGPLTIWDVIALADYLATGVTRTTDDAPASDD